MHKYLEFQRRAVEMILSVEEWLRERGVDIEKETTASVDRQEYRLQNCYHSLRIDSDPLLTLNWAVRQIGQADTSFYFEMYWCKSGGQPCRFFVKYFPHLDVWLAGIRLVDRHDAELPQEVADLSILKENPEFSPLRHALHSRPTFVDNKHPEGDPENPPIDNGRAWDLMTVLIDFFLEQRKQANT